MIELAKECAESDALKASIFSSRRKEQCPPKQTANDNTK